MPPSCNEVDARTALMMDDQADIEGKIIGPPAMLKPPEAAKMEALPASGAITLFAVSTAVLSSFLFGYQVVVLNSCAELIAVSLQWCNNQWQSDCGTSNLYVGFMNASVYLGAAVGALLT